MGGRQTRSSAVRRTEAGRSDNRNMVRVYSSFGRSLLARTSKHGGSKDCRVLRGALSTVSSDASLCRAAGLPFRYKLDDPACHQMLKDLQASHELVQEAVAAMDRDDTGTIEYAEFLGW
eukprot:SAG31_NODE_4213_length_3461_cov_1.715645_2_plen_119_part_00